MPTPAWKKSTDNTARPRKNWMSLRRLIKILWLFVLVAKQHTTYHSGPVGIGARTLKVEQQRLRIGTDRVIAQSFAVFKDTTRNIVRPYDLPVSGLSIRDAVEWT